MLSDTQPRPERTAYILKVYPRFSETFVVTEILAREAAGEDLAIYALRPTRDSRFHPQLAQVQAPVTHLPRAHKLSTEWGAFARAHAELPDFGARFGELMPLLVRLDPGDAAQAVELALALRRDGITRMHVHFATLASWCAAVASALTGIPYTLTTHAKDIFHHDLDPILLREILQRAEKVVAISEYNRRHLLTTIDPTLGEDKVVLVRNGLDLPRFSYRDPEPPHTPLRVLAVGRVVEKKGFDHLVEAVRQLHGQGMPLDVRIVGEGELLPALRQQVADAGLTDVVSLLGSRSQAELVAELDWADVMAAPCVVGADGNADGLPTVLLEAMASGVPCVATDVTGIPEAVHPARGESPATGILLSHEPAGLPERVAAALRQVADPAWPRVDIARAARALIERDFDTTRQVRLLADLARPVEARR
ncbi:glycosyltransferase [Ornithinimicrobium sufpigmenti]|uniref:glycosyltransferase n=1 Tax=Ornithinimicrobium sufpigmenti TaxID=2508882 RepID=UPI001EDCFEBD|nr:MULTISPECIES: glycosyltransferase [unclassified Ornithinimicrobium]